MESLREQNKEYKKLARNYVLDEPSHLKNLRFIFGDEIND